MAPLASLGCTQTVIIRPYKKSFRAQHAVPLRMCIGGRVFMYHMVMDATNHAWELVFKRDGRVFTELLPAFTEAAAEFERRGCQRVLEIGRAHV